jgi:hypothetical protein
MPHTGKGLCSYFPVQIKERIHQLARSGGEDMLAITLELWKRAWPAMLRNFLNCACDRITLALVGHYDYKNRAHFDGAGLGKMFGNSQAQGSGSGAGDGR